MGLFYQLGLVRLRGNFEINIVDVLGESKRKKRIIQGLELFYREEIALKEVNLPGYISANIFFSIKRRIQEILNRWITG